LAWQSSGRGSALVFFAGALANHELWRDVVVGEIAAFVAAPVP
jgi:hypothetical protein